MTQTVKVTLNPTEINKFDVENIQIINALNSFLCWDKSGVWVSHQDYEYTYQQIKYRFNFTRSILKRTRKEGREGLRFEIFNPNDTPLGKGGYGIVYSILGTIKFNAGKTIVKIDYGLCIERGQQDYRKVGTRAYRPPESFLTYPVYTFKSDVYSAGRILSFLWGDDYQNYYIARDKEWSYIKNKSTNEHLFNGLYIKGGLSTDVQSKIRNHLNKMLHANPNIRPTIDESINHFSQIDAQPRPKILLQSASHASVKQLEAQIIQHIQFVRSQIIILQEKEIYLRERRCDDAADTMSKLINEIRKQTQILERKPELSALKNYQNTCLTEIKSSKQVLQIHRDSWWLVAEILTAISLLGVGYVIALGVNFLTTNRIGLFSQTKSDQLVEKIEEAILDFMPTVH